MRTTFIVCHTSDGPEGSRCEPWSKVPKRPKPALSDPTMAQIEEAIEAGRAIKKQSRERVKP